MCSRTPNEYPYKVWIGGTIDNDLRGNFFAAATAKERLVLL